MVWMKMVWIESGSRIPFVIRPVFLKFAPGDPLALHILNLLADTPASSNWLISSGFMTWIGCVRLVRHFQCASVEGTQAAEFRNTAFQKPRLKGTMVTTGIGRMGI